MPVTVEQIRALREQTGAGIMECKQALEEHDETDARSFQLNASTIVEQCHEIIEYYERKNNSIYFFHIL